MKRLVLGIGNPIIGDDGAGFRVIAALESDPPLGDITLTASDVSGFAILDYIVDCDEVVIVDAIQTVNGRAGDIYRLALDDFRVTKHTPSAHDVDLPTALEIGKILNMHLPRKISIVAIEIPDAYEFSNDLTPPIQAAVSLAVRMVKAILAESQC
jgi:hydrogenase maturation protease